MRQKSGVTKLRQDLLTSRGLEKHRYNKPGSAPAIPSPKPGYTKQMLMTEALLKVDLREWLFSDTAEKLAAQIHVNKWTILRWRKHFNGRGII